jgi:hypothetical protein
MTMAIQDLFAAMNASETGMSPSEDGITHINISTAAQTELGRKLAHYSVTPFVHPVYGPFRSMEGFWHYIKCETPDDVLRTLCGNGARSYAKGKKMIWRENFSQIINEANYHRIVQNSDIREAMITSTLPFTYYYLYGPEQIQIHGRISRWLCAGMEEIRCCLKEGRTWSPAPVVTFPPVRVQEHCKE